MKAFPLRSGLRQGCPVLQFIQKSHSNPIPTAIGTKKVAIWPDKGIKGILIGTEEIKVSLFAQDTMIYLPRSTQGLEIELKL